MSERTLVLVKPDGVSRGLTGAILARIEAKGYTIAELKRVHATREILEERYARGEISTEEFRERLRTLEEGDR